MAEIAIAAAVAAAVAAASYTVQYALTPKAKPIEKGRLSGDIQIQDSRYGAMIPILLGGEPHVSLLGCNPGELRDARWTDLTGLRLRSDGALERTSDVIGATGSAYSTNVWAGTQCVDIQWEVLDVTGSQQCAVYLEDESGAATYRNGFHTDLFFHVPTVQRIKDGSNYLSFLGYDYPSAFRITTDGAGNGTIWHMDGATIPEDQDWSSALTSDFTYDTSLNYHIHVAIGGYDEDHDSIEDPAALGPVQLAAGSLVTDGTGGGCRVAGNVIFMSDVRKVESITPAEGGKGFGNKNPDTKNISYFCDLAIMFGEGELGLAELLAGTDVLISLTTPDGTGTGLRYPAVGSDPNSGNLLPIHPSDTDVAGLPALRYGNALVPDANGTVTGTMAAGGGADFRFYSGSETQLPDPLLEAHWGVGNTPAYLGRSYIVLENFEVGKYGSIPNFTAILNNLNLLTAADCLDHLMQRVGLDPADFDVSNVSGFNVRGIPITNREAPTNTVALIGSLFGFDVVETNGEILCIERGSSVSFTVTDADLGTVEVEGTEDPQSADIPEQIQNELQLDQTTLPRRLDVTFFDPARKGETNTQGASRLEALALGFVTQEVNAVLTVTEARQYAQRLLDTAWIEGGGAIRFTVPHTFADDITAAAVGTVTRNGITHTVRVKEVNGFVPGVLEVQGIVTRAASYSQTQIVPGSDAGAPVITPVPASIPATTVATFIDRILRDRELQDGRPGFYVAACSFGNGSWGGCNVYVDRGAGYVQLINVPEQATMGIVNATDDTIGGATTLDVELYGDQSLPTYTAGEVTAGAGYIIVGELILQYQDAEQLSTTPNLWRLTTLSNIGAKCTSAENGAHAADERFVVLNQALRFISVESTEIAETRDYKAVTIGADINDAGVISFQLTAPNISITTPSDYAIAGGVDGSITHSWTPFSDACVMTDGLLYEIHADSGGSPGALIYSGSSRPYKEVGLVSGTYTRHFRARTRYADGSYVMRSVTLTVTSPPNVDQLARDMAQLALGIARQARAQGGATSSGGSEDDVARHTARTALGIAQEALRQVQSNPGTTDVLQVQVFS